MSESNETVLPIFQFKNLDGDVVIEVGQNEDGVGYISANSSIAMTEEIMVGLVQSALLYGENGKQYTLINTSENTPEVVTTITNRGSIRDTVTINDDVFIFDEDEEDDEDVFNWIIAALAVLEKREERNEAREEKLLSTLTQVIDDNANKNSSEIARKVLDSVYDAIDDNEVLEGN